MGVRAQCGVRPEKMTQVTSFAPWKSRLTKLSPHLDRAFVSNPAMARPVALSALTYLRRHRISGSSAAMTLGASAGLRRRSKSADTVEESFRADPDRRLNRKCCPSQKERPLRRDAHRSMRAPLVGRVGQGQWCCRSSHTFARHHRRSPKAASRPAREQLRSREYPWARAAWPAT
jgi:hypothetical protein